ncbi:MAG: homoserine dehydrogenase, partial [Clostridiales bacterium]|nr:homoserine dehydrogenase [Candidatus Equinaster intestinalis]
PYSDKFTKNFDDILSDDSVRVVAEVMGGIHPAYDFVKSLLLAGKSVVTSNKELVAAKGAELLRIANENNVNFLFEASVGGGIPILRPLAQCLAANEIKEIYGILNGTTNFILTKMVKENTSFDKALKTAQELGFAEKNPDADILGFDACRKVCILAALGFGKHVYPEQVDTAGITDISLDDVDYADKLGYVIKLLGRAARLENGKITATVAPTLIERENMIAGVNGVYNAIVVVGDASDDLMFYGKGAGKRPTASAVVADIIDCVKHLNARKYLSWEEGEEGYVESPENVATKLYVRLTDVKSDSVLDEIKKAFGSDISIFYNGIEKEIAFVTKKDTEKVLKEKITALNNCTVKTVLHSM